MQNNPPSSEAAGPERLIANRYRLGQSLGKGSFGEVFFAYDIKFDPPKAVAVKVLHPQYLNEAGVREEIRREASVLARFNHPNILRVIDFDVTPELAYIVTDLAEGGSLSGKLRPDPTKPPVRISLEETARYLEQIAEALDEAHANGLAHRDIKPLNILLDKRGRPMLADFGLAAALSTSSSSVLVEAGSSGTPLYMAPEQWNGQAGKSSDIYALGVLTYQLLAGQVPFQGNHAALAYQHLNNPVPKLSERAPDLHYPPALDAVLAGAMAKDPRQRTRPASEFARRFRAAIEAGASGPTEMLPNPQLYVPTVPLLDQNYPASPGTNPPPVSEPHIYFPAAGTVPPNYNRAGTVSPSYSYNNETRPKNSEPSNYYESNQETRANPVPPNYAYNNQTQANNPPPNYVYESEPRPVTAPPVRRVVPPPPPPRRRKSGLLIGLLVGFIVVGLAAIATGVFLLNSSKPDPAVVPTVATATATQAAPATTTAPVVNNLPTATPPPANTTPAQPPKTTVAAATARDKLLQSSGQLAFTAGRDGQNKVYLASLSGGKFGDLVEIAPSADDAVISPDGKFIAYHSNAYSPKDASGKPTATRVYISPINNHAARVAIGDGVNPTWSPDGRYLVWVSEELGCDGDDLVKVELDRSNPNTVAPKGSPTRVTCTGYRKRTPRWSVNNEIVFSLSSEKLSQTNMKLVKVAANAASATNFTQLVAGLYPNWSPDGTKIVYSSGFSDGKSAQLYLINSDGSQQKQLTSAGWNYRPMWSSNGLILFSSNREKAGQLNYSLWVMNPDGSQQERLTVGAEDVSSVWAFINS